MKTRSLPFDSDGHLKSNDAENIFGTVGNRLNSWRMTFDSFVLNEFVFSPHYRLARHLAYWTFHVIAWAAFWMYMDTSLISYGRYVLNMILWMPVFMLFSYPLAYWAVPQILFKGKIIQFFLTLLAWGAVGIFISAGYQTYCYVQLQEALQVEFIPSKGFQPQSYLSMTTSAAIPMIIKFFKLWTYKQREWMTAQQGKIAAELQLLKAQVHPHFLFNTLNNIYMTSLENSPKTPGLILKLSSLLSYMLYDCNSEQVRMEKEVNSMRDYIELERERYGNQLEVSWSVNGNVKDKFIPPLLMLPFLENAFKHGMADDIKHHWMSVDISVKDDVLRCKIANCKSESVAYSKDRCGNDVRNVKSRLALMYPKGHEMKMHDEGNFFVVSLHVKLNEFKRVSTLAGELYLSPTHLL